MNKLGPYKSASIQAADEKYSDCEAADGNRLIQERLQHSVHDFVTSNLPLNSSTLTLFF